MVTTPATLTITWEKLPGGFVLDDEPGDHINQPALAAALTESLKLTDRLPQTARVMTNCGIWATSKGTNGSSAGLNGCGRWA